MGHQPLFTALDLCSAPSTRTPGPLEDPVRFAPLEASGGGLLRVLTVVQHQPPDSVDQAGHDCRANVANASLGCNAGQEKSLRAVERADPGEIALIEQSDPDLGLFLQEQPT